MSCFWRFTQGNGPREVGARMVDCQLTTMVRYSEEYEVVGLFVHLTSQDMHVWNDA